MLKREKCITDGIQKNGEGKWMKCNTRESGLGEFFLAWYVAQWIYLGNEEVTKDVKK